MFICCYKSTLLKTGLGTVSPNVTSSDCRHCGVVTRVLVLLRVDINPASQQSLFNSLTLLISRSTIRRATYSQQQQPGAVPRCQYRAKSRGASNFFGWPTCGLAL